MRSFLGYIYRHVAMTVSASRRRILLPIAFVQVSVVVNSGHVDRVLFCDLLLDVGCGLVFSMVWEISLVCGLVGVSCCFD